MWIRIQKTLFGIGFFALMAACSKTTSGKMTDFADIPNAEQPGTQQPGSINENQIPSDEVNPQTSRDTLNADEILKSIKGEWSSTCRDTDATRADTSEKDVVFINVDENKTSLTIHTLHYSGSRSCEKRYFKELEESTFSLNNAQEGHSELEKALALDLVDPTLKKESAQNVLLVFASPENSALKARILFEVLDTQRTTIRMQIQEWKHLLPERFKDHDTVILQLESIFNEGTTGKRSTHYTKSQAFSRSSEEDLALINN